MTARARSGWMALALVALAVLAHGSALSGGFIWDDEAYVIGNANLRSWEGLARIWLEPRTSPQYYPLVFTTLWMNYQAHGLQPLGYHLVNLLLHVASALLAWRVLARLAVPGAWLAAVLFAVHPVHVESVAWVTERKNVLSAALYLSSAWCFLRFAGVGGASRRRVLAYVAALLLFAASLLAKTVTCTLPAALALVLWWQRGSLRWRDAAALAPFLLVGVAAGLATIWLERVHVGAEGAEWTLSPFDRALIAGRAVWFYAGKLAWPHPLAFMYPRWTVGLSPWWMCVFPTAALAALAVLWQRRDAWGRGPLAGALFYVGSLFPALGFFNIYPMRYTFVADHYVYLSSLGLLALAGAGLARMRRAVRPVLAATLVLALATLAWNRGHVFRSAESLWRDTLKRNAGSWMAHNNLGLILAGSGRGDEAMLQFQQALALRPASPESLTNLGMVLAARGRRAEAIARHREALALSPDYVQAWNNLGIALSQDGQHEEALRCLRHALELRPRYADAYLNLGHACLGAGRVADAMAAYREVLALQPLSAEAANNLSWLLATSEQPALRNPGEAVRWGELACQVTGYRDVNMLGTLAAAYAAAARPQEAVRALDRALALARAARQAGLVRELEQRREQYRSARAPAP